MRILLFLFFSVALFADEELIVRLAVQGEMTPIYLAPIAEQESGFPNAYISQLEKILRFDFDNNGKTEVVKEQQGMPQLQVEVKQGVLRAKLIVPNQPVKGVEGLALIGDLAVDRQIIHRVHDLLFQEFFHTRGIADTRIVYTVKHRHTEDPTQWTSNLWIADYDGQNAQQLTHDNCLCVTPLFVPVRGEGTSNSVLYVSYKTGQPKIFAQTIHEKIGKRVTYLRGNQLMPTLSPQLDKLVFVSDIAGNPDLFLQDFSPHQGVLGKPRQLFSAPGATQGSPTFSPDGKQIAFVSNKDGSPRIYVLDVVAALGKTRANPRLISKKNRENTSPAWSPDGQKIAYSAMVAGVRQICLYHVASGEEVQLTEGYGHKENPAWGPDSFHLLFNSSTPSTSDLYMINLHQKKAVKITQGSGEKRFPAWEPLARKLLERKV